MDMDRLEDSLSFALGKAYQQVQQDAKRRLAPHGVTPVQYAVLKLLWERDEQIAAELGERLVLDSATMTGLIDRLVQARLVERRAHSADRRVNVICLTKAGVALQAPLDAAMDAVDAEFASRLKAREMASLRAALRDIALVR